MVTANVDIAALKARHPLGDTVEASGVRLRGRGRVRQGVCPFHDEAEGSFTVYGDSERFYCFGCGEGGDVLDFVRRVENLSLPEAIARLDGSPGLTSWAAVRPAGPRRTWDAALPPRDPTLLTAAGRFYAGQLRRSPAAWGVPGLAGRRPGCRSPPRPRLCAGQRAARGPGVGRLRRRPAQGLRPVHGAGTRAVRRNGRRSRRHRRDLSAWLVGRAIDPDRTPPVPGVARPQAGAWAWAARPRAVLGGRGRGGLRLARPGAVGTSRLRRPGHAGHGADRRSSPGLPPRLPRLRRRRCGPGGDGAASDPARTQGRRRRPSPRRRRRGRACGSSPRTNRLPAPAHAGRPLRPLAAPRPPSPLPNGTCSRFPHPHSHRPGGPMPNARRAPPAHGFP